MPNKNYYSTTNQKKLRILEIHLEIRKESKKAMDSKWISEEVTPRHYFL